ncbi:hypothetical protein P691DRAFT_758215 [Macrolepiota fuliginosa MF-IS2]|uniref:F-box domain-containing protein n=1 Tax=Macrolepiota fuliginosa MF-IS2 TaxID=1400762 RepID=A0A9P5XG59_9AGAR|nr:hypothetical protein P691DRAFT_758215 [Macrolepiota fuliginosa MF-IS2]
MCGFNDLPDELLLEVLSVMVSSDSKKQRGTRNQDPRTLRLVSKRVNVLVTPWVFSDLHLNIPVAFGFELSDWVRPTEIMNALATSSPLARIFEHTTVLYVSIRLPIPNQTDETITPELGAAVLQAKRTVQQHLFATVVALKNLRSVSWVYYTLEPPDIMNDLVRALGTLKSLTHFELYGQIDSVTTLSLQPLCNLHSVKISWSSYQTKAFLLQVAQLIEHSPNLQELVTYNSPHTMEDLPFSTLVPPLPQPLSLTKLDLNGVEITPEDVHTHIRHFHNLKSLKYKSKENPSSLWPSLGEHNIHLKSLSTNTKIYPLLSDYLISYTGLEELHLEAKHLADNSSDVVDKFYSILAHHHRTLKRVQLKYPPGKAWAQKPTDAQLEGISKCNKLEELLVNFSFTREELRSKNAASMTIWLQTAMRFPKLEHLRLRLLRDSRVAHDAIKFSKKILKQFERDSKAVHFDTEIRFAT